MRKNIIAIIVFGLCLIIFFGRDTSQTVPYDDYDRMCTLSTLSETQLKQLGFSNRDVSKIQEFPNFYNNYIWLKKMLESGEYKNYGYDNGCITNNPKLEKSVLQSSNEIVLTSSVLDYYMEEKRGQYKGRILVEAQFKEDPTFDSYAIGVEYPNFVADAVYSVVRYICKEYSNDYVDLMIELPGGNFYSEFFGEVTSEKKIEGKQYILESCVLILDVGSDLMGNDIKFDEGISVSFGGINIMQNQVCLYEEKMLLG